MHDRAQTSSALPCPLCDYDLRGQVEPRCPECGYRFTWEELTDPALKLHPYLFEHHPRRNVWSFVRTMLGGLRPRRFWSSLKPSQPSRPRRLVVYWFVSLVLVPLGYATYFGYTAAAHVPAHRVERLKLLAWANRMSAAPNTSSLTINTWSAEIGNAGGPQAWVDMTLPPPLSVAYLRFEYQKQFSRAFVRHVRVAALYLVWPWVTLAALMIFRASMERARVGTDHVLRCALYCCDAGPWLAVAVAMAVPALVDSFDLGRYTGYSDVILGAPLFGLATTWRLSAAYRHYLQFDRPFATAVASQAIVVLVVGVYLYAGAW